MLRIVAVVFMLALVPACARAMDWNGLFIAGDDSIEAFDNSQRDLIDLLTERGLDAATRFTASRRIAKRNPGINLLTEQRADTLDTIQVSGVGQGCIIHLTSHGAEDQGFYLSTAGGMVIDPDYLARIIDADCGPDNRTVLLVSACYSGQFITDALKGPNRIILTAARADRPSFGCSADATYTYWDGCVITELPRSKTWARLYDNVVACIDEKEAAIGAEPSEPQAWFGENTRGWRIMQ